MHEAGLSHNDFHLGNILAKPDGSTKIVDMGMAERSHRSAFMEATAVGGDNHMGNGFFSEFADGYLQASHPEAHKEYWHLREKYRKKADEIERHTYGWEQETAYQEEIGDFYNEADDIMKRHNVSLFGQE